MKLAVSNIAWDNAELAEHLRLLRDLGCDGVEIAPSCVWSEPVDATAKDRAALKRLIAGCGLAVAGFHALFYTRPDLQLFRDADSRHDFVDYLRQLVLLCRDLGGAVLVCGSPRNRVRYGRLPADALPWAAEVFRTAAAAAAAAGVVVCIEPLPSKETEFIVSSDEGMELVALVDHPNFGLHLDSKAMVEQGEDIDSTLSRYGRQLRHFHVSDPGLTPPGSTGLNHAPIGLALSRSGYDGYVSIEMRRGVGPTRDVITRSVDYVRRCYFDGH